MALGDTAAAGRVQVGEVASIPPDEDVTKAVLVALGPCAEGARAVGVDRSRPHRADANGSYWAKRGFDVVVSLAALLTLWPLMALIWLAVVCTSPGPGIHSSVRIGRYGRNFNMPKFRTMLAGGPSAPREVIANANERVTPLGRFLRRTALDELPQLWCILIGDMSFIGPRPLLIDDPGACERAKFPSALRARPGLTGLAQVKGRNLLSPRRKARLDAFYARAACLNLDIRLLLRTVVVILTGRGFI